MTWGAGGGVGVFDARVFDSSVFHAVFGFEPGAAVSSSWASGAVASGGWSSGVSIGGGWSSLAANSNSWTPEASL